ncbi:MAG TPA: YbhB/YbcL family Raf kinase inhibitor-like protein [Herbaspirillum sp.]|nr:YbhB/YbcL family Raf kinase inhibitor-like protein [Herbaspirillum sp.]
MQLYSDSFQDGGAIPAQFAFGKIDPATQVALSTNRNPHLAWRDVPAGVKSLVIICNDPDVPSVGDDVNQKGKTVAASLPRVDFCHWLLVDLPATTTSIAAAQFADGVTPRGKSGPQIIKNPLPPARHGLNGYTDWFAGDADMGGDYFGYDGPCPPWNDALMHHYVFTVYALDLAQLPVDGKFTRPQVLAAMQGHILAQASLTGLYTLNPAVI